MTETLSAKAAQALEWPKVLECVAQGAQSVLGAARCRAMVLDNDIEVLARRQRETTEWLRLSEGMKVTWAGKLRTALTMLGVVAVLAGPTFDWFWLTALGSACVQIGAVLHVLNGIGYARTARRLSRGA